VQACHPALFEQGQRADVAVGVGERGHERRGGGRPDDQVGARLERLGDPVGDDGSEDRPFAEERVDDHRLGMGRPGEREGDENSPEQAHENLRLGR